MCPAYISKINSNCEKQIILSMIPNKENRRLALSYTKKISVLIRGIALKHHGNFNCLNCLRSFRTENKLKSHEKVCKNKDFCIIIIPSEKGNMLEFN